MLIVFLVSVRLNAQTNAAAVVPTAQNFAYPQSLFIDSKNGHIWVADFDHHRIVRFDISTLMSTPKIRSLSQPERYVLHQNYPNPFNPETYIGFTLRSSGFTTLKVFDLLGKEVATLLNESREPGSYTVSFNASHLPSGVYLYTLRSGAFVETRSMILMK